MDSANLINELIAWASFSANRIVRALAVCMRTSSTLSPCPRNHSSPATPSKTRANFSWMAIKDNVHLAWSHSGGRMPRFSGCRTGWILVISIASLSAALAISSSEGSSAASGMGGHHEMVGSSGSLSPFPHPRTGHSLCLLHLRACKFHSASIKLAI